MQRGEDRRGELAGICGWDELAAVAQVLQACSDGFFPADASCGDVVSGDVIELGEFAAERSERAASLAAGVLGDGDDLVPPGRGGRRRS